MAGAGTPLGVTEPRSERHPAGPRSRAFAAASAHRAGARLACRDRRQHTTVGGRSARPPYRRRRKRPVGSGRRGARRRRCRHVDARSRRCGRADGRGLSCAALGGGAGEVVRPGALDDVAPVPPAQARVQVLNAGGQRGQANLVAAQLGDLGFPEAARRTTIPLYADADMECVGQLRFGPTGQGAARTLGLVLPCTELVRDDRTDDVVSSWSAPAFATSSPPRAVRNALDQIGTGGGATAPATPTRPTPGRGDRRDPGRGIRPVPETAPRRGLLSRRGRRGAVVHRARRPPTGRTSGDDAARTAAAGRVRRCVTVRRHCRPTVPMRGR